MNKDREAYKRIRNSMDAAQRTLFSNAACCAIINSKEYLCSQVIMPYSAFGSELDLMPLITDAMGRGKRVVLPCIEGGEIVPRLYDGTTRMGAYGISEPCGEIMLPQLVIAPMLAFNSRLYRTGYGKGYYDRFLSKTGITAVGAAFSCQRANFAEDEFDIPMQKIFTEDSIYEAEA